ncbi:MAG: VCBS repeat-containing protein, partial [Deltaproteobacteria bacterium]
GFPFRAKFTISSQPVLGDLNDDGRYEIVFGSEDFHVYAVDGNGRLLKGFPQKTGYRIYAAPALADVDGDGRVEIITAGGDGKLYVHRHDGKRLAGFPRRIGSRLKGSACAGDLAGDGRTEIVAGSDKGKLYVFRSSGARYPGFPVSVADRVEVSCLLGDFDHDGVNEVLAAARNGQVGSWRIIRKGSKTRLDWPMEARDARRSGRTWPNPPRYTDLKILPERAPTTAKLQVHYRHFDLDGDPEPGTIINWYRNGKLVKELSGSRQVDARYTAKHQRWKFVLQAEKDGPRFESPTVEIVNSPPEPAVVEIVPAEPRHGDSLEVKVSKPSNDADGDRIRYRYTWLPDKVSLKKQRKARIPGALVRKGQRWTAVVRPFDGEVEGSSSYASVTVGNTPPVPPVVAIAPAHPRVTDSLKAVVKKPSTDVDGDAVEYRYIWRVGKEKLNLARGSAELPARMARKGELVKLEVVPFDGQEEGKSALATTLVENSPPGTPEVAIHPSRPNTLDTLSVRVTKPAPDEDGDRITYRARWTLVRKGAKPKRVNGFVLPAKHTAKGQTWRAEVAAFDGQASGRPAIAEITIGNAPPSPPRLAAEKGSVLTTDPLRLKVLRKEKDPDGDEVTVDVEWFRLEGKKLVRVYSGKNAFVLSPDKTRKNRFYLARATVSDGMTTSEPGEVWFEVKNTPPPACKVRIEPARPRTGQQLNARADRAKDADGDGLELHYEWFVNGKPEIEGKGLPSVPARMVKAGQKWRIEARWYDGEEYGPECAASVEVMDSQPVAPKIALEPQRPACGQALKLRIVEPARDPDGQPVELETRWFTDGRHRKEFDGAMEVPGGVARKGQKWTVEAVARAADVKSKPARAEVTVGNCAPNRPKLSIEPERPLSSQDVRCVLGVATRAPDGKRVSHEDRWLVVVGKGK